MAPPTAPSHAAYDLRRLRLNGLIRRIDHTHTYVLTPDGQRLAIFCMKLYNRLLRALAAAHQRRPRPAQRQALAVIDHHVDDYIIRGPAQAVCALGLGVRTPCFFAGVPHS